MLPLFYRLKCKEVCQRWYTLLMTRGIFREDRYIRLSNCLLEESRPPMTVFLKSKLPYESLILDGLDKNPPIYDNFPATLKLWQHFGKSVTELHLDFTSDFFKIICEMPGLKGICVTVNVTFDEFVNYLK